MHISIEKSALLKGLDRVRSVVEARNTIPILSNLHLAVSGGTLFLRSTDLDIEATARVETSDFDSADGEITVPAATLYDIARKLADGSNVRIRYDGDDPRLLVTAGRSRFNLPVLSAGDFPVMSHDGLPPPTDIASGALADLLDMSMFAMSTEETRYYLNGVYMHMHGPMLRFVATDGHRMAMAETTAPEGMQFAPVIVHRKTVRELRRMLDNTDVVSIQASPTKVRFAAKDGAVLVAKVIDGAFPDYARVIPRDNEHIITFDPAVMASAVDRVATITGDKARSVKFEFDRERCTITVRNMDAGQAVEEVEVDYDGPSCTIGLNARYVLDVLARIKTGRAVLALADPGSPTLFREEGNDGRQFVVMPLRV